MSVSGAVGLAFTRNNSFDNDWSELSVDPLGPVCTKVCDYFSQCVFVCFL